MDHRIERALAEIHARLASPLTIADLARATHLSPSRFAHLFLQHVGTSPARYVHALRMIRARLLIERTFLSIKEVMVQVGCSDPSHFARDFRDFHGLSPREWRTTARPPGYGDPDDALESATVSRIAVLANERRKRPTKPLPRARAPDGALDAGHLRHPASRSRATLDRSARSARSISVASSSTSWPRPVPAICRVICCARWPDRSTSPAGSPGCSTRSWTCCRRSGN